MTSEDAAALLAHDHAEIDGIFREFRGALDSGDGPQSFNLLDLLWARLAIHIRAENLCLFPAILHGAAVRDTCKKETPSFEEAQRAVSQLRLDHDFFMHDLARAVNYLRTIILMGCHALRPEQFGEVRQIVEAVKLRLELHNQNEESHLYKWPALLLNAEEQARLAADMRRQIENLPPRFRKGGASQVRPSNS
jgi:iron-sulfur cluster repair protein YtfE (RIC family)